LVIPPDGDLTTDYISIVMYCILSQFYVHCFFVLGGIAGDYTMPCALEF
jgi:hypothetical protein